MFVCLDRVFISTTKTLNKTKQNKTKQNKTKQNKKSYREEMQAALRSTFIKSPLSISYHKTTVGWLYLLVLGLLFLFL